MDFNDYQRHTYRWAPPVDGSEEERIRRRYANFAMGLAGEAGEACDYLKKVLFHGHELDKEALKKELGDVLWYTAALATAAGFTLDEVAQTNIDKLTMRFGDKFSTEGSINRVDNKVK